MSNTVNVDFITKVVEIEVNDNEPESLAAMAAVNAAKRAEQARDFAVDVVSTRGQWYVDKAAQKVDEANSILSSIRNEYGYPFTAATADAMTDPSKIYVYTGSETGYTNGDWYYHNGTGFVSGGVYNSTAFETDKTLSVDAAAADAKVAGSEIGDLKKALINSFEINKKTQTEIGTAIATNNKWNNDGKSYFIPVDPTKVKSITVTANAEQVAVIALVKSSSHANGTSVDYATGTSRTVINAGETSVISMPSGSDCTHFVAMTTYSSVTHTPASIVFNELEYVDETLSQQGMAADAKIVGDYISENFVPFPVNTSIYNVINYGIGTSNKWINSSGQAPRSSFVYVPESVKKITVKAHATNGSIICLLKNNSYSANATADYATGEYRRFIAANTTETILVPSDCRYINYLESWSGVDYLPQSISLLNQEPVNMDDLAQKNGLEISGINFINNRCVLARTGLTDTSTALSCSQIIPTRGCHWMTLTMPHVADTNSNMGTFGICFYDKDMNVLPWSGIVCPFARQEGEARYKTLELGIPNNARYFRTTWWNDTDEDFANFYCYLHPLSTDKDITNERPASRGIENAIRRARQLTDIKWTPAVNISRYTLAEGDYGGQDGIDYHFTDWFKAGVEYTGVPYSGSGETESWSRSNSVAMKHFGYFMLYVGHEIDFETYVTAARYPNSIVSASFSDDPSGSEPRTERVRKYDGSIFGIVCNGLVSYALGLSLPAVGIGSFVRTNAQHEPYALYYKIIESIANSTNEDVASSLRIGDVLWTPAHVIIVTDIFRDNQNNLIALECSEATTVGNPGGMTTCGQLGGLCRRITWELSEFCSRYRNYGIYRFMDFSNVTYTPSRWVDTGNEGNKKGYLDMPLIPYCGNGFRYKVDHIVNTKLLIGMDDMPTVVVTKDGETFGTFTVDSTTKEVEVGFTDIGEYTAYLTNGTYRTKSCRWSVVAEDSSWS